MALRMPKYGSKGIFSTLGQMVSSPERIKGHITLPKNRAKYGIGKKGTSKADAAKAFQNAYQDRSAQIGRRAALGMGSVAVGFGMRPGSNQSRTSYRGPMQTGRGVGRYA